MDDDDFVNDVDENKEIDDVENDRAGNKVPCEDVKKEMVEDDVEDADVNGGKTMMLLSMMMFMGQNMMVLMLFARETKRTMLTIMMWRRKRRVMITMPCPNPCAGFVPARAVGIDPLQDSCLLGNLQGIARSRT